VERIIVSRGAISRNEAPAASARVGQDRDPLRIQIAGELGRVDATVDVRDLRRREGDDLGLAVTTVDEVEVVEVAPCGAGDEHAGSGHA
jgi:hypothetical protein